jgi:hypothetical protein
MSAAGLLGKSERAESCALRALERSNKGPQGSIEIQGDTQGVWSHMAEFTTAHLIAFIGLRNIEGGRGVEKDGFCSGLIRGSY